MAIDAAVDIVSFDADIVRIRAAVSPPFGRAEDPDNRGSGRDGDMRRAGIAANVKACAFCEFVKSFQARLSPDRRTRCGYFALRYRLELHPSGRRQRPTRVLISPRSYQPGAPYFSAGQSFVTHPPAGFKMTKFASDLVFDRVLPRLCVQSPIEIGNSKPMIGSIPRHRPPESGFCGPRGCGGSTVDGVE